MSGLESDGAHIQELLGVQADSQQVEKIAAAVEEFVKRQGWQKTVDDLIVRLRDEIAAREEDPTDQKAKTPRQVNIHTDGACIGNPGPGGWCAILIEAGVERIVLQGANDETTNNRMEMQAVISGLQQAPRDAQIDIWSDSQYVCKAFNDGWLKRWQKNGWKTQKGAVLNQDLWVRMTALVEGEGGRTVRFHWVKGHAGDPLNEEADQFAHRNAQEAGRKSGRSGRQYSHRGGRRA